MLQDVLNDSVVEAVKTAAPVIVRQQSEIANIVLQLRLMLEPIFTIAIIFGAIFAILRLYLRKQHEQRMLMIEKGMVEVPKNVREPKQIAGIAFAVLGFGIGLAIGMLIQSLIYRFSDGRMSLDDGFTIALACGLAAASYLVYYFKFVWKKEKEQGNS